MSMDSLLSWDDFEEETPLKEVANQSAALKAAENLKNLDTTEAEKELAIQGKAIEHTKALHASGLIPEGGTSNQALFNPGMSQEQLKAANQSALERASKIVQTMDAQLEAGGRVDVSEKFLLNCKADLNQLVPFKYNGVWSLYLTSCENHWMPAELDLGRAALELETWGKGTPRKMIARLYYNYKYRKYMFNEATLLNCYRMITNPECRQYLLRQAMESATITHAMTDFEEVFKPTKITLGGEDLSKAQWVIDGDTFKLRYKTAMALTTNVRDFAMTTDGLQNTSIFLEELIYLYGYINWIMQIVPIYQLMNACRLDDKMPIMVALLRNLIKDMQAQTTYIKLFISTAFDENPDVLTDEFKARVFANFKKLYNVEWDLPSTLANTDTESGDVMAVVEYYIIDFLNTIGLSGYGSVQLNENNMWFVQIVSNTLPKVDHEAGLSGNGGSLGW